MCLNTVSYKKIPNWKIGYKVYKKMDGKLITPCRNIKHSLKKTYIDKNNYHLVSANGRSYLTGYHIFRKLKDAQFYCDEINEIVVKIRFSDIVAHGTQKFMRWYRRRRRKLFVIVARKITLLEIVNNSKN